MNKLSFITLLATTLTLIIFVQQPAMAYIGPGAGLAAIGAFLAIVVGVIVAIIGFAWYPIKRFLRKIKKSDGVEADQNTQEYGDAE